MGHLGTMVTYKIVITDLAGTPLGEITDYKSLSFQKVLNREGDCIITAPIKSSSLNGNMLLLGQRDIYIYRNDDIAWGGRLLNKSGRITGGDDLITLASQGFMSLLKKRVTTDFIDNTDAGEIVWTWIDTSQNLVNGDLGITKGTVVPSKNRQRLTENSSIYEEMIQLTEVKQGIDLEITQTKVYNSYYPQGSDKSATVKFQLGKNIETIDWSEDFSDPVNEAIVLGGGYGQSAITETRENTDLQEDYGLFQEVIPYKNVEETTLLQDKGDKEIIRRGLPRKQYTITQTPESEPDWTSLSLGDWVRVDVDYGVVSIHDAVRISTISVSYSNGIEVPSYSFIYD